MLHAPVWKAFTRQGDPGGIKRRRRRAGVLQLLQAVYATRLLDLPVYPPGVLGVALWAHAFAAWQSARWHRELAAAPPTHGPSAAELEEASRLADEREEDAEWRNYEAQVFLAQQEALRGASSELAADYFADGLGADAP